MKLNLDKHLARLSLEEVDVNANIEQEVQAQEQDVDTAEAEQQDPVTEEEERVGEMGEAQAAMETIATLLADKTKPLSRQSARFLEVTLEHLCLTSNLTKKTLGLENFPEPAPRDVIENVRNSDDISDDVNCYVEQIKAGKLSQIRVLLETVQNQLTAFDVELAEVSRVAAATVQTLCDVRLTNPEPAFKTINIRTAIDAICSDYSVAGSSQLTAEAVMCLVERLTVVEEALESTFTGTPIADIGERLDRITASVESITESQEQKAFRDVIVNVRPLDQLKENGNSLVACHSESGLSKALSFITRILENLRVLEECDVKVDTSVLMRVLGCLNNAAFITRPYFKIKSHVKHLFLCSRLLTMEAEAYRVNTSEANVSVATRVGIESIDSVPYFNMHGSDSEERIELAEVGKAISIIEQTYLNESWLEGHVLVSEGEVTAHSIPNLFKFYPELVTCLVSVMKEDAARVSPNYAEMHRVLAESIASQSTDVVSFDPALYKLPVVDMPELKFGEIQLPGLSKEQVMDVASALKQLLSSIAEYSKDAMGSTWVEGLLNDTLASKFTVNGTDPLSDQRQVSLVNRYVTEATNYFMTNRETFIAYNFTGARALLAWLEAAVK